MAIKDIYLRSFRNHTDSHFEFNSGMNVLWGPNGSGKTSVLEGIYLLAYARSFRTKRILETLQDGCDKMNVTGRFETKKEAREIQLNQILDGRRRYLIDGQACRGAKDLIGLNPVVVLSPEEQNITKGTPGERRLYFDRVFSVVSQPYVGFLSKYTRALKQRNAALNDVKRGLQNIESVNAWNEILVDEGIKIWDTRAVLIDEFNSQIIEFSRDFTSGEVNVGVEYQAEAVFNKEELQAKMFSKNVVDLRRGYTSLGPHRDKYEFEFNGSDLRKFGSQGEHKLSLVLIKMAEARFASDHTGKTPTILLDDLFAKLDRQRSEQVLKALGSEIQTIITSTDINDLEAKGIDLSGSDVKNYFLDKD